MGRHKEIACPQCGFVYAVNASEEVERRSYAPPSVYSGHLRQLPVPGARLDEAAELQGRPHPGDDVPLRPAVPAGQPSPPGALGRGRLPLSRGARGQLHQAAGRPARRDDPDPPRRHLHQAARRATRSGWRGSRSSTSRPCRSTSTTTDTGRRRLAGPAGVAALAARDAGGWQAVGPGAEPLPAEATPSDEWAELRYRHLVPDPEQWDADRSTTAPLPREPRVDARSPTSTRTTPT